MLYIWKKYLKIFGGIKKMLYLCTHKSETSDKFFEKKIKKDLVD
jgi:hypothetical protein